MHAYTYSAHPTCCAVALKNLDIIEQEHLCANAETDGQAAPCCAENRFRRSPERGRYSRREGPAGSGGVRRRSGNKEKLRRRSEDRAALTIRDDEARRGYQNPIRGWPSSSARRCPVLRSPAGGHGSRNRATGERGTGIRRGRAWCLENTATPIVASVWLQLAESHRTERRFRQRRRARHPLPAPPSGRATRRKSPSLCPTHLHRRCALGDPSQPKIPLPGGASVCSVRRSANAKIQRSGPTRCFLVFRHVVHRRDPSSST